jgi:hypothetical protein
MSVKKDPTRGFLWVSIAIIIAWRAVRAYRGEFS